jgi:branched-chain amino acid transport system substrate-binding protein
MSNNTKIVVGVVVLLLVVWAGYSLYGKSGGSAETVKIGVITPLSGDAAAYGQETQRVLDYRLAGINAQKGTKFELVYEDGKCAGSDAVSAFQKLIDVDGVKIIIGGTCSSETLGMAPLTKDGKALVVSPASSNPTIEGTSPYTFTLSYSDQVMGETIATEMSKFSKVAIITEQNDFNIGFKTVWEKKIAEFPNAKIVANETFPKGASEFRNLLSKIRKANPEAVFLNPNVGVTAETLLKQLAEMKDWKGYKVYTQFAYLADNTRAAVGDFVNGMTIVDAPNLTDPNFLAYKAEIEKNGGALPTLGNYYTASTIDDLDILTALVRELGNDQKAVRDALSTRTFKGYLGDISFDGHSFKQGSKGGVYVVESGKAVYQK